MKLKISLVAILLAVIFSSCSKNDLIDEDKFVKENYPVEINVFYTSENSNDRIPDVDAKVYLYYDVNTTADMIHYTYEGEGVFKRGDTLLIPDEKYSVGNLGKLAFELDYLDRVFSVMVESAHYPDQMMHSYNWSTEFDAKWTFIFNK